MSEILEDVRDERKRSAYLPFLPPSLPPYLGIALALLVQEIKSILLVQPRGVVHAQAFHHLVTRGLVVVLAGGREGGMVSK
jgi:hypothetical protein